MHRGTGTHIYKKRGFRAHQHPGVITLSLDEERYTSTQRDVKDEVLWLKELINVAASRWEVCNGFP
jgi:hypothetical protein